MPNGEGQQETDPEKLCQMLDLKLARDRVAWQRTKSQRRTIRVASFLFLFLLIIGALVAYFLILSRVEERRSKRTQSNSFSDR